MKIQHLVLNRSLGDSGFLLFYWLFAVVESKDESCHEDEPGRVMVGLCFM